MPGRQESGLGAFGDRRRQQPGDRAEDFPGEGVVAGEAEMDVLVEQLAARQTARRRLGEGALGVDQQRSASGLRGGDLAQYPIDPGVGSEAQGVEITGPSQALPGFFEAAEVGESPAEMEVEFGMLVVEGGRRGQVLDRSLGVFPGGGDAGVEEGLPLRQAVCEVVAVEGGEWRLVTQVAGNRYHQRAGAGPVGGVDDVAQAAPQVVIDRLETGITSRDAAFQEHLHAPPLARGHAAVAGHQPVEELTEAQRAQADAGADSSQAGETAEDRRRTPGAHHLVVAEVEHEQVGIEPGAVADDRQHDVGVDRRHRGVVDLEGRPGIAILEHHLEDPPKP